MPIRFIALVLAFWLSILPAPVEAGQSAHYRHPQIGATILVEVQGDDARLEISGQPWYLLIKGGESFWVYPRAEGTRVLRVADFERAVREGVIALPAMPPSGSPYRFVARGTAVVAGYRGVAYHVSIAQGTAPTPSLVVSRNPRLAALGRPLTRHLDSAILQFRLSGQEVPPGILRARQLLEQGTALILMGFRLERLDSADIAPDRLALPAEPVTYEEALRNFQLNGLGS